MIFGYSLSEILDSQLDLASNGFLVISPSRQFWLNDSEAHSDIAFLIAASQPVGFLAMVEPFAKLGPEVLPGDGHWHST